MPEDEPKSLTATTVRELGMQFNGFKEVTALQFKEVNGNLTDLVDALHAATSTKADQKDFAVLASLVDTKATQKDVDTINTILGKNWVKQTASAVMGVLVTTLIGVIVFLTQYIITK